MADKPNDDERPRDLAEDQEKERELEERVDEMMEVERDKKSKKIEVKLHVDDDKEELPADEEGEANVEESTSQDRAEEGAKEEEDDTESTDKEPSKLDATIVELNEQLLKDKPGPPPLDPESDDDTLDTEGGSEDDEPKLGVAPEPSAVDAIVGTGDEELDVSSGSREPVADETELKDSLDTPDTDWAVEDIVAKESDEILSAQDEKLAKITRKEKTPRRGLGSIVKAWAHSKFARWMTLLVVLFLLAAAAVIPNTRYFALNAFGVRSGASVTVTDASTFQPLKNVSITIAGQTVETDIDGKAVFTGLKLGPTHLRIEKRAFAPIDKSITVGWGSNPLGGFEISPVGTQYGFTLTDFLSGKPIVKAQATAGDASALSDENGKIKLTLDHSDAAKDVEVVITAEGYRDERRTVGPENRQDTELALVPNKKSVYISKRSGKYDVYAIYADGSDEKKLLEGTGNERENLVLTTSPDGQMAALVSTRDNVRNDDGFLKSALTLISVDDGSSKTVTHSEQITLVGWIGSRLVYVQVAAGTSAGNPSRSRLMSYDYASNADQQLAATNYFNSILIADNKVFYAPSSTYQAEGVAIYLFSINADGSNKQTVLADETWSVFRVAYDTLSISVVGQQWYDYTFGDAAPVKTEGAPGNLVSRRYTTSPDGSKSLWVEDRDGKGTLLVYDTESGKDTVLQSASGLMLPVRWLNNSSIVYRVSNGQETADYALNISGGDARKIVDVTNTGDLDRWYYY